jgi:hypothetical protein
LALPIAIVLSGGYALLALADDSGPASAARGHTRDSSYPERPVSGLVAILPFVGSLTWQCEEGKEGERFRTQLDPPEATIYVSLRADGKEVWHHKRVDPLPNPNVSLLVGTPLARRSQTLVVTYRHAPATIKVTARLRFAASESQCVVARSTITTQRIPH